MTENNADYMAEALTGMTMFAVLALSLWQGWFEMATVAMAGLFATAMMRVVARGDV